jgi:hypothetical protein
VQSVVLSHPLDPRLGPFHEANGRAFAEISSTRMPTTFFEKENFEKRKTVKNKKRDSRIGVTGSLGLAEG